LSESPSNFKTKTKRNKIANVHLVVVVAMEEIREKLREGYEISWVGAVNEYGVEARLRNGEKDMYSYVELKDLPLPEGKRVVRRLEATKKLEKPMGPVWQRSGWLKVLRTASIYGINLSSHASVGPGSAPMREVRGCTMGYDIEVSQEYTKHGSFPPYQSKITSIALWCDCGYCEAWTTLPHSGINGIYYCVTSKSLVRRSLNAISEHRPKWLVGYNCYQFDNCALRYHAPEDMKHLFRLIFSGSRARPSFTFYLDLRGVNNVDLYARLDKSMRGRYKNLSLGTVAQHHGLGGKLNMPKENGSNYVLDLIRYNIVDSRLTSELWYETGACNQVMGLCSVSCSPVVDCVRHVTGTMASCAISSYCILNGALMDWSSCELDMDFEGGLVLEPTRGLIRNVTVCDFSSMYPTIMQNMGLSPENIIILGEDGTRGPDRLINWSNGSTIACVKGMIIGFNSNNRNITSDILSTNMSLRKQHKKSDPNYANSLKEYSNSMFGAYGYPKSPLYSPRVAATITLAGRTALSLAYGVFTGLGLRVVYGDTDSCFLAPGPKTKSHFGGSVEKHITSALEVFHCIVSNTPFYGLTMEREDPMNSIILVDKKHYAYSDADGKVKTKGLSHTRKDRLGICRDASGKVASIILNSPNIMIARRKLEIIVNEIFNMISAGSLDAYSVSKEVRYEGTSCYAYTNKDKEVVYVPVAHSDSVGRLNYDIAKVLDTIERDLDRICVPSGVGCVADILRYSDILF
jgi:DNA polymerase elongation subunit (family B)